MKRLLLILLCLPMIAFGQELCKEKKCLKCAVTCGGTLYVVQNGIYGILEGKYKHLEVHAQFLFPQGRSSRVDAVEFYLRNKITNEKSSIRKNKVKRPDRKDGLFIRLFTPFTDLLDSNEYYQDSNSEIEIYFRSLCYNSKYHSEWFVQDVRLDFSKVLNKNSDIENILHYYLSCNCIFCQAQIPEYNKYCTNGFDFEIHNPDFDIRSYFYDSTFVRETHITYTSPPSFDYIPIATITIRPDQNPALLAETLSKRERFLSILKDIGLDVIYKKEIGRTPIHTTPAYTTPTYTTPTYTAPTTHIAITPGVVKSYPGQTTGGVTYGGVTYGGGTTGGVEYDIYTYTLIESKRIEEEIINESKYDILLKLSKLKDQGILTDEEFQNEKKKILD